MKKPNPNYGKTWEEVQALRGMDSNSRILPSPGNSFFNKRNMQQGTSMMSESEKKQQIKNLVANERRPNHLNNLGASINSTSMTPNNISAKARQELNMMSTGVRAESADYQGGSTGFDPMKTAKG